MSVIKSARAIFEYTVHGAKHSITVGAESSRGKTKKDWETSLCIDAGRAAAKKHGVPTETIVLLLTRFEIIK